MNSISEKFERFKKSDWKPFAYFSLIIVFFCLLFTRLIIKTDDGNFLGISRSPDFTYLDYLRNRYQTLSGRTVGEFLVMFFIKHNIIWWKICNSAMIICIAWFWCRLSQVFNKEISLQKCFIFNCSAIFLMAVTCLNPAAFWFSGSFTYLWPFAGVLMTIYPLTFYILDKKLKYKAIALAFLASFIGSSQEQAAASLIALYLILITVVILSKLKLKLQLLIPLIPTLLCSCFLFSSPGARRRGLIESDSAYSRYFEMSLSEKLLGGLSNFFANSFYLSVFLTLLLVCLLSLTIYNLNDKKIKTKRILIFINIFTAFICIIFNALILILKKERIYLIIKETFISGKFDYLSILIIICSFILLLLIITLTIVLIYKNKRLGLSVGLCLLAGFGCAISMSFSASIFSSGQRVFFFTNMFVITAVVIIVSSLKNSKLSHFIIYSSICYSAVFFIIDCVCFRLFEIPLMG